MKFKLFPLIAIVSAAAWAAVISGSWKATSDGPMGSMERTFVFKVDGSKLTGETTSSMLGKSTIDNGKIDGDKITFSITAEIQGNSITVNYSGTVKGDTLELTSEAGGQSFTWKGKRTS